VTFDTLEELREYKAKVKAALTARLTGVSGSISGGGFSQSFTRSSISELRAELEAVEAEERNMLGKSAIRTAYITGKRDGFF
jgi:hypothetical protein